VFDKELPIARQEGDPQISPITQMQDQNRTKRFSCFLLIESAESA